MTKNATKFQAACRRFREETDLLYEEMTAEELLEVHFQLAHTLRGTLQDRLENIAMILQSKQGHGD